VYSRSLPSYPAPTNQSAEITAIIIALEEALDRFSRLRYTPRLNVRIHSNSKYAIGCMTEWIHKWLKNGWRNAAGKAVAYRDLIEEALELEERLIESDKVKYVWVPRAENLDADAECNRVMDEEC
jgi:ribonuclease HI